MSFTHAKLVTKKKLRRKTKYAARKRRYKLNTGFEKNMYKESLFVIYSVSRTCALNARFRSVKLKVIQITKKVVSMQEVCSQANTMEVMEFHLRAHKKYIKMT